MKKQIKTTLKIMAITMLFVAGILIGANKTTNAKIQENDSKKKVGIEYTYYQEGNKQEIDGFYLDDSDLLVMLTDGSYAIFNGVQKIYTFQPVDLGDWDYSLDSEEKLINIIKTYISMKNTGTF
ncbi:hypothetical protein [Clostridium sp.]|uniref:hypothetical protein n=1 Tax=Clostridium sp. TaxID=1506 RepID=UPI0025B8B67E|nr:hypothetical protein [Clostridium sp.]MCI9070224.1 hypothetical protein [Clostridium sp.]